MSNAMYPAVFNEFEQFRAEYGPVDKLPTKVFLAGLDNGESTEVCYYFKTLFNNLFSTIMLFETSFVDVCLN
jgi:pyruvate carboxylase